MIIEALAVFGGISLLGITGLSGYCKYQDIKDNIKTKLKQEIIEELRKDDKK